MQAVSGAYTAVMDGNEVTVDYAVELGAPVTIDATLALESLHVERQLTTNVPAGTSLISGYPAASATVTLSGLVDRTDERKTAAWYFNPYATDSPLYRTPLLGTRVTIRAGVYTSPTVREMLAVFTGTVDECNVDPAEGTVTLTCIDDRNRLRSTPALPPVANNAATGVTAWSYTPLLSALYAVDYLLRANGVHSGPAPREGCFFYASLHGSMWPEVATGTSVDVMQGFAENAPAFTTGRWCPQVPEKGYTAAAGIKDPQALTTGAAFYVEWWQQFLPDTAPEQYDDTRRHFALTAEHVSPQIFGDSITVLAEETAAGDDIQVYVGFSVLESDLFSADQGGHTFSLGVPPSTAWHRISVGLYMVSPTSAIVRAWRDGVLLGAYTVANGGTASMGAPYWNIDNVWTNWYTPVDTLQVCTGWLEPNPEPVPGAVLDASLNPNLTVLPDVLGSDPWDVIQGVAAAEGAVAGFDETGVFRFRNRETITQAAPVRTLRSRNALIGLAVNANLAAVANAVRTKVNVLSVQPYSVVWSASEGYMVPARGSLDVIAVLDNPAVALALDETAWGVIPSGGLNEPPYNPPPYSGYRASRSADGTGREISDLRIRARQVSTTRVELRITNPHRFPVWLVTPKGAGYPSDSEARAALAFSGQPVIERGVTPDGTTPTNTAVVVEAEWPPKEDGGATSAPGGETQLELDENPWRQDVETARHLVTDLLGDLYQSRPLWRDVAIVPDVALQLGDRVRIDDPDASLITGEDGMVIGLTLDADRQRLTQTVDLRTIGPPGAWLLGVPGRSELGQTTYA